MPKLLSTFSMRTDGLVEEAIEERAETPLPVALALLVWLATAVVLVGASILG